MKTYLKMFFKKLGVVLVRIFYCLLPFLRLLEVVDTEPENNQNVEQDQQRVEQNENEVEEKSE